MSDATCGCKHWPYTYRPEAPPVFVDGTRFPGERAQWVRFCPAGTEALGEGCCSRCGARLNGDGTMEPRPSDEYVRLLEVSARTPATGAASVLLDAGRKACAIRTLGSRVGLQTQTSACSHEDPPLGCLRALAAEREKTKEGGTDAEPGC